MTVDRADRYVARHGRHRDPPPPRHHRRLRGHDRYWQALGFTLDFETGHGSAKLDPPSPGPYVFVDTVDDGVAPTVEVYLDVADHAAMSGDWEATHWGTFVQASTDPDGRTVWLQEVGPDGH